MPGAHRRMAPFHQGFQIVQDDRPLSRLVARDVGRIAAAALGARRSPVRTAATTQRRNRSRCSPDAADRTPRDTRRARSRSGSATADARDGERRAERRQRKQRLARRKVEEVWIGRQAADERDRRTGRRRGGHQRQHHGRVRRHVVAKARGGRIRMAGRHGHGRRRVTAKVKEIGGSAEELEIDGGADLHTADRATKLAEVAVTPATPGQAYRRRWTPCEQLRQLRRVLPDGEFVRVGIVEVGLVAVRIVARGGEAGRSRRARRLINLASNQRESNIHPSEPDARSRILHSRRRTPWRCAPYAARTRSRPVASRRRRSARTSSRDRSRPPTTAEWAEGERRTSGRRIE